jgi:effector-binding domain-containing protein
MHSVSIVTVRPRMFAAVRARLPVAEVPRRFAEFLDQVYAAARDGKVQLDGQNIFVYRPTSGDQVEAEFGVGVTEPFVAIGSVYPSQLPTGTAATTTIWGPYSGIRAGHSTVIEWCRDGGKRRTGTRWEVYGHWTEDPAKLRTDIFHQLA